MGWHELSFVFADLPQGLFQRNDDDMYDRLSHRWTAAQLIGFALLVTTTTYVGDPIHCWVPDHFAKSWEKYTSSYCWIKNTYYLPFEYDISPAVREAEKQPIIYYQWVPMILLLQALMFVFPIVLWRALNTKTGMDMNDIIETAEKVQYTNDNDHKRKLLSMLANQTHRYLSLAKPKKLYGRWSLRRIYGTICGFCGKRYGNYITTLYIIIKLMFLGNVIGQLWLLNLLLGQRYAYYGIQVVTDMWLGNDWTASSRFPRVTMCDIDVRRLGNNNKYTVQCVLTVNFFNEKIYLYLWWWFVVVAVFTIVGLIILLLRILLRFDKKNYIQNHIVVRNTLFTPSREQDRKIMDAFVHEYLRSDGVLLMRLIGHNTNKVTVTDFICACYEHYRNMPEIKRRVGSYRPEVMLDSAIPSADTSYDFGEE